MKWINLIKNKFRLWRHGKVLVACANGKCLHTLDAFGHPQYIEVDKDFEGVVYCSIDCMQAFDKWHVIKNI